MPRYDFLIDTYRTEIDKVVSVWAMFDDADLATAPPHRPARSQTAEPPRLRRVGVTPPAGQGLDSRTKGNLPL
jgi:hypothetical protein